MPQKRNRAGELQNYVPAGNGDASGEYGDKATGSNKNFKTFEKPKGDSFEIDEDNEQLASADTKDNKPLYKSQNNYTTEDMTSVIMKSMHYSKKSINVTRVLNQLNGDNINPEIRDVVLDTLMNGNYDVIAIKDGDGFYRDWDKSIHFSSTEDDSYANGETFFHEVGHALDYTYSINGWRKLWSKDYVSKKYGKTMLQMKEEELGDFLRNGNFDQIMNEYSDLKNKLDSEAQPYYENYKKYSDEWDELRDELDNLIFNNAEFIEAKKIVDEISNSYWTSDPAKRKYESYNEYKADFNIAQEKVKNIRNNIIQNWDKLDEFNNIKEQETLNFNKYYELKQKASAELNRKYMDLSDMCQAVDIKYKFNGGHKKDYFSTNTNKATECFAEIQSALGTNKESLEVLQRYIPKTIEIYKEILGVIGGTSDE